ncbi:hypothetical protein FNF27_06966 [Cafeteria roenbergensis]|uniref:Uncharacterized protein n=2 Tax=Cafeteria roenbergensis TaxID=33653 RepID=A0A5A8DVZ9_CAFRO|nr:hypothetical protein FNF27_06966 [Cafeteria roenbergensis]
MVADAWRRPNTKAGLCWRRAHFPKLSALPIIETIPSSAPHQPAPQAPQAMARSDRVALTHGVPTEIDGEPVLVSAELSSKWTKFRCCTCSMMPCVAGPVGIVVGMFYAPIYALFCGGKREEEAASWQLLLTPTALHFTQKVYSCGCCCQTTRTMAIPLDKIQDLAMVSDCCGDCCGFSEGDGIPWQLHVQTAGSSASADGHASKAELVVFCLKDMTAFRSQVLTAKRKLLRGDVSGAPAGKESTMVAPAAAGLDSSAAAATLGRMEALMEEALGLMRSGSAPAGGASAAKADL